MSFFFEHIAIAYGIGFAITIPIIIYLIRKRIRDKENEKFEKREN